MMSFDRVNCLDSRTVDLEKPTGRLAETSPSQLLHGLLHPHVSQNVLQGRLLALLSPVPGETLLGSTGALPPGAGPPQVRPPLRLARSGTCPRGCWWWRPSRDCQSRPKKGKGFVREPERRFDLFLAVQHEGRLAATPRGAWRGETGRRHAVLWPPFAWPVVETERVRDAHRR